MRNPNIAPTIKPCRIKDFSRFVNSISFFDYISKFTLLLRLVYFFSKVLTYHFIKNKTTQNVVAALKVHSYFVSEYKLAAQKYNREKLVEIFSILREFDLKSKGIGNVSVPPGDLLKEMIYKILH